MDAVIDSLSHVRELTNAAISPDGAHVAWVQSREDPGTGEVTLSIYLADLRKPASAPRRVTAGNGTAEHHEREVSWSPDGKRLAFLSDAEKSDQSQLYIADV